jgi:hypothetical protein
MRELIRQFRSENTKPLEGLCALQGFMWAAWLNWTDAQALPPLWQAFALHGGGWVFRITIWPVASFQLVGMLYRWPRWRKYAACAGSVYWFYTAWALGHGHAMGMWQFWDALFLFFLQLSLVFHRAMVEPTNKKERE